MYHSVRRMFSTGSNIWNEVQCAKCWDSTWEKHGGRPLKERTKEHDADSRYSDRRCVPWASLVREKHRDIRVGFTVKVLSLEKEKTKNERSNYILVYIWTATWKWFRSWNLLRMYSTFFSVFYITCQCFLHSSVSSILPEHPVHNHHLCSSLFALKYLASRSYCKI